MTVESLKSIGFKPIAMPCPEREIEGVYIGDLLSWVMGRARENNAWVTIMSNVNVLAVASLADVSCVVLAEGVELDEQIVQTAKGKGVNVLQSELPAFETALALNEAMNK